MGLLPEPSCSGRIVGADLDHINPTPRMWVVCGASALDFLEEILRGDGILEKR
jgi:hypothetical protein